MMHSIAFSRRARAPLALSVILALPAGAQERQLFTWTGRVDRAIQLTARANSAVNSREENMQTRGRFRLASALPRQDGTVRVVRLRGRGPVTVVQQPASDNNYTAIVEVTDPEGGAEVYEVAAYWTPVNGDVTGNRGRGRGYGYGNQRRDAEDRRNGRINAGDAPSLRWNGEVDSVIELIWRGGTVSQRLVSGAAPRNTSTSVSGNAASVPNPSVVLSVRSGRGRVEVVQEPSASNRYTTILRITDPEPGYGRYVVDAYWR